MTALELVSDAIGDDAEALPCTLEDGICCFTGVQGPTVPRGKLVSNSFTARDLMRRPDSGRVGVPAWRALRYRPQRMSSWLCAGGKFHKLDRKGIRDQILNGVNEYPWAGYVTTSYKKHGALVAPVNSGGSQLWRFEAVTVDCSDRKRLAEWWEHLNHWLRAGIVRSVLESGRCSPYAIKCAGVQEALAFDRWAADKWRSPLYQFLCYLLPSQEELKNEKPLPTTDRRRKDSGDAPCLPGFD